MTEPSTRLLTADGRPVLRFERNLAHPPHKVWRFITEPDEMRHWFPTLVQAELRVGASMRFWFDSDAPTPDAVSEGEILELDPPRVYAFRWGQDVLRFELLPSAHGCVLVFTHTLGGGRVGRLGAGRNAAGWDACLEALDARLAGADPAPPADFLPRIEAYVAGFELGDGEVVEDERTQGGYVVRFARDLMWSAVEDVWSLLSEGTEPKVGAAPPPRFTNRYVPAGEVGVVDQPRTLEYTWLHAGEPAGLVRFELRHDPALGTRVELTQTVPDRLSDQRAVALAAWHTHLELLFAAVQGEIRCWPEGRTEELTQLYRGRLDADATR
jgi:uncharacterized protein YndB with AHSA1/START domain